MKKLFLVFLAVSFFSIQHLSAQFEIKIGPIVLGEAIGLVALEYGFKDNFGMELTLLGEEGREGGIVLTSGKYYFKPRYGLDRFHIGMFLGLGLENSAGFLMGTKLVSRQNFYFEAELGGGRSFDQEIGGIDLDWTDALVGYLKLNIGYRFGPKPEN